MRHVRIETSLSVVQLCWIWWSVVGYPCWRLDLPSHDLSVHSGQLFHKIRRHKGCCNYDIVSRNYESPRLHCLDVSRMGYHDLGVRVSEYVIF